jgi:glycosyltransferase involved in cell wall biosynthesis
VRVLIGVHQFFPRHYTGTERYVLNLAKHLQKMGHYVKVLTYAFREHAEFPEKDASNLLRKDYSYEGVPVISLRHRSQPDDLSFVFDILDMDIYGAVAKILEEEKFDVYHCAHPLRIASSIKAARDAGVKVIFMVTDYFMMCPMGIMMRANSELCDGPDNGRNCLRYCFPYVDWERMQRRNSDARMLVDCCNLLLSPSRFLIRLFDQVGFIPGDRFVLSRHGFDYTKKTNHFDRQLDKVITFGYIGTIQHHKGVHVMIEGFQKCSRRNIRLQVWGGCFNEIEYEKNLIEKAKGDPRIEFKGYYEFNEVERILRDIDVVIVPSIWYENAPLTISTSLAYGIPVITSDVGGMSEMVKNGQNGLTFSIGDPADLSKKIGLIADNADLLVKFKRNIRYPIRLEEEAFNTELVYKQLMAEI